jgi:hypothetical protein
MSLHKLLDAIQRGEIDASDPRARRLHRQIEGAVAAWEAEDPADDTSNPDEADQ